MHKGSKHISVIGKGHKSTEHHFEAPFSVNLSADLRCSIIDALMPTHTFVIDG